jgi:hypothetical protein
VVASFGPDGRGVVLFARLLLLIAASIGLGDHLVGGVAMGESSCLEWCKIDPQVSWCYLLAMCFHVEF